MNIQAADLNIKDSPFYQLGTLSVNPYRFRNIKGWAGTSVIKIPSKLIEVETTKRGLEHYFTVQFLFPL